MPGIGWWAPSGGVAVPAGAKGAWLYSTPPTNAAVADERAGLGDARPVQPGMCLAFNGVNQYVNCGAVSGINSATALSFSCLFMPTGAGNLSGYLFGKWSPPTFFLAGIYTDGNFYIEFSSAYGYIPNFHTSFPTGIWHQIVFAFDGSAGTNSDKLKCYVNGDPVSLVFGGTIPSTVPNTSAAVLDIGRSANDTLCAIGRIKEFRFYNTTLSQADALKIFTNDPTQPIADIVDYKFEDSTGTTLHDSSGNGNHGTLINGPTWTEDKTVGKSWANDVGYSDGGGGLILPRDESDTANDVLGNPLDYAGPVPRPAIPKQSNCRVFDGVDDWIDTGFSPSGTTLSIAFWFKSSVTGSQMAVVSNRGSSGNVAVVTEDSTGKLYLFWSGSSPNINLSTSAINDGNWHHCAISVSSSSVKMWVDGTLERNVSVTAATSLAGAFDISQDITSKTGAKSMFGVMFYDAEIDQSIVDSLYAGGINETGLTAFYPLSEASGTTAHNVVANANHGTINGGATVGKQDVFHYHLLYGAGANAPALLDGSSAADGNPITKPAGIWLPDIETELDFTSGEPNDPVWNGVTAPTAYGYGDALPANMSKRVQADKEDRFYISGT